ncbi:hypothetical protein AVEN_244071-1 [Araneus ventricosus]|uniref:Uncharacterized protein n=1 Tax=Araneus ventricosus TaxID=182803 RepID=A0A4Y2SPY4_ARAVE|nr:hypothetical protein AVEN_244071-1 [Araneus ventricosus]
MRQGHEAESGEKGAQEERFQEEESGIRSQAPEEGAAEFAGRLHREPAVRRGGVARGEGPLAPQEGLLAPHRSEGIGHGPM